MPVPKAVDLPVGGPPVSGLGGLHRQHSEPTNAKPSSAIGVTRGIVRLDAFNNAISVYSDPANWFGLPRGSAKTTRLASPPPTAPIIGAPGM